MGIAVSQLRGSFGAKLEFCTLAAGIDWDEAILKAGFCQGLNPKILSELACQGDQASFNSIFIVSIDQNGSFNVSMTKWEFQ